MIVMVRKRSFVMLAESMLTMPIADLRPNTPSCYHFRFASCIFRSETAGGSASLRLSLTGANDEVLKAKLAHVNLRATPELDRIAALGRQVAPAHGHIPRGPRAEAIVSLRLEAEPVVRPLDPRVFDQDVAAVDQVQPVPSRLAVDEQLRGVDSRGVVHHRAPPAVRAVDSQPVAEPHADGRADVQRAPVLTVLATARECAAAIEDEVALRVHSQEGTPAPPVGLGLALPA